MTIDDDNAGYSHFSEEAFMEAQNRKQCALERYLKSVSEETNMCSSEYINVAQMLAHVTEGNYNDVLNILNKATLPDGALFEIEKGEVSRLYVRNPNRKRNASMSSFFARNRPSKNRSFSQGSVFDLLHFEDSCMGAWQAFLFHQSWHYLLPVYRHGYRYRRFYIYSKEDLKRADDKIEIGVNQDDCFDWKEDSDWKTVGLRDAIKDHHDEAVNLAPEVFSVNGRYYVSCCYWTAWGGLIREHAELVLKEGLLDEFIIFKDKIIWPFDCGIIF